MGLIVACFADLGWCDCVLKEDMDDDVLEGREPKWKEFALPKEFKEMMAMRLDSNSKNLVSLQEDKEERRAKDGPDNDLEGASAEENVEDDGRKENGERKENGGRKEGDGSKEGKEEKEPGISEDVGESERAGGEVEDGTVGDEEGIVERTQNLEVTESTATTPRRRGARLSGVAALPRLPPIGNFAPPIRGRGGIQRRRARGRGGFGGRMNRTSTRGRRSDEAIPARSENLSEAPNSSSQNTEDTGETTEEENSNSGKEDDEEVAEDPPLVLATPKRVGRGRGRAQGGSGAGSAVVESDSVRRSIRNK